MTDPRVMDKFDGVPVAPRSTYFDPDRDDHAVCQSCGVDRPTRREANFFPDGIDLPCRTCVLNAGKGRPGGPQRTRKDPYTDTVPLPIKGSGVHSQWGENMYLVSTAAEATGWAIQWNECPGEKDLMLCLWFSKWGGRDRAMVWAMECIEARNAGATDLPLTRTQRLEWRVEAGQCETLPDLVKALEEAQPGSLDLRLVVPLLQHFVQGA